MRSAVARAGRFCYTLKPAPGFPTEGKTMRRVWIGLLAAVVLAAWVAPVRGAGTVPAGSSVIVTLDQSVSSKDATVGQKVDGSIAENVVVGGNTVIPKGSKVSRSVASVQASGRLSTPAKLWLKIDSITVNGRAYAASSRWSGQTGPSHNKRNVVVLAAAPRSAPSSAGLPVAAKAQLSVRPQARVPVRPVRP